MAVGMRAEAALVTLSSSRGLRGSPCTRRQAKAARIWEPGAIGHLWAPGFREPKGPGYSFPGAVFFKIRIGGGVSRRRGSRGRREEGPGAQASSLGKPLPPSRRIDTTYL